MKFSPWTRFKTESFLGRFQKWNASWKQYAPRDDFGIHIWGCFGHTNFCQFLSRRLSLSCLKEYFDTAITQKQNKQNKKLREQISNNNAAEHYFLNFLKFCIRKWKKFTFENELHRSSLYLRAWQKRTWTASGRTRPDIVVMVPEAVVKPLLRRSVRWRAVAIRRCSKVWKTEVNTWK